MVHGPIIFGTVGKRSRTFPNPIWNIAAIVDLTGPLADGNGLAP